MIRPTRASAAVRPLKSTPAFQLPSEPISLVGFDSEDNVEMQLSAAIDIPAAIGGAKVTCTLAFYDDINRGGTNPPAYFTRVYFSAFIDNDSLKKSTLLHGVISN